ncbi:MAG: hypothetical protein ACOZDY_15545 [Pseudomonadota bacterium]
MPITEKAGLFISFDKSAQNLIVTERRVSDTGQVVDHPVLEFSLADNANADPQVVEQTLGQLMLYSLEKLTPGGLGFGSYADLLDRISDENFEVFCHDLDLNKPEDQYDFATMLFSRGRRKESWEMVERAIELFEKAAASGHDEAKRFLAEDLPIVRPRLEEKLKRH